MTSVDEITAIWDCFKGPFEILLCCCGQNGIIYATTEALIEDKNPSMWDWIWGSDTCGCARCAALYLQRQKIKAKYSLVGADEKTRMKDLLCICCCGPCFGCQNYRAVVEKAGKSQPSFGGSGNKGLPGFLME